MGGWWSGTAPLILRSGLRESKRRYMDRLAEYSSGVAAISGVLLLTACNTMQGVHVLNETNAEVSATAVIVNEHGRQELDLKLPPNLSDGWQYKAYPWEASDLHATFKELRASSEEGCELEYDRKEIESAIVPRTRNEDIWLIIIDREACGLE